MHGLRSVGGLGRIGRRGERQAGPVLEAGTVITLRLAARDGDAAVAQLVQLSGHDLPIGPSLVAEVDGEPRAALPLGGGELLVDPFHPAAELGSLLTLRLAQLDATPSLGSNLHCA
jgi:hypothetical protein